MSVEGQLQSSWALQESTLLTSALFESVVFIY